MISRFAKDMQAVDDNIPMQFDMCVRVVIILILNFCVIGYITPAFMLVVAPIMVLYWYVQKVYKLAALQFKRLDSTTRSPIYNQFSESLGGLATIRAYAVEPICEDKNADIVNTNTRTQFTQKMVERWWVTTMNRYILFIHEFACVSVFAVVFSLKCNCNCNDTGCQSGLRALGT